MLEDKYVVWIMALEARASDECRADARTDM